MSLTSALSSSFQTLRHRNYRLFFLGQVFSLTGNSMELVAETWLVYRLTGSPLALGLVGFIALVPVVPISLFGAALIDRVSKRKLLLATQSALVATYLVLAGLTWSGQVQVWHIVLIQFVAGGLASIDLPARQAFLPEMVAKSDLPNSIALNTLLYNCGRVVGPALAGLIIASVGEAGCFFLNSVSFLPLLLGLTLMRDLRTIEPRGSMSLAGKVVQGFGYMLRNATLVWLLALMSVSTLLLLSYSTMMPVFAKDVLLAGPQGLGLLMTGVGSGAVLGSLWLTRLEAKDQQRWLMVSLYLLPISVIAFLGARGLALAFAIVLVVGAATTWMQTIFNTLVQLHVRDDMRGRTMSMYLSLLAGMQRIGGLQAGLLAEFVGVPVALAAGAAASILCTTVAFWRKPKGLLSRSPANAGLSLSDQA